MFRRVNTHGRTPHDHLWPVAARWLEIFVPLVRAAAVASGDRCVLRASPALRLDQVLYTGFAIYDKEGKMAQRVTIEMMDDLDGSQADETVRFAVDGNAYEIDLSQKNAAEIRRTFDRYIEHARKAARGARQAPASRNRR